MSTHDPTPTIVDRGPQRYIGMRELITMQTFGRLVERVPQLVAWMTERGIEPAGAPFFRYLTIDMERTMDVEAGIPVRDLVDVDGAAFMRTLPAGRFVTTTHVGHPEGLLDATTELLRWAEAEGLRWDVHDTPPGQQWGCRLEIYHSDPQQVADMTQWQTELAFRLAEQDSGFAAVLRDADPPTRDGFDDD